MTAKPKDGGPAFPVVASNGLGHVSDGMTLRDWFAGKALAAGWREFLTAGDAWDGYDDFAASCYAIADAMVKAREAKR